MPRRNGNAWATQVPDRTWRGPYEDYGWEAGQSGSPEFRDPSVHLTEEERRRVEQSMGKQLGKERSWRDWEMEGPYTGYGLHGYHRSDERIREDVCERLTQHGRIDARNMDVEVHEGEVILRGTVEDRYTKRMAEDVAESVSGVWDVRNELRLSRRGDQEWGIPDTGREPGSQHSMGQQQQMHQESREESGMPGGGQGRTDQVGGSGVYPASGPMPEGDADVRDMAEWGQGDRGAEGYNDHGDSEIHPS